MACKNCEGHCNNEEEKADKIEKQAKQKRKMVLYTLSVALFLMGFLPVFQNLRVVIYFLSVAFAGYDLILEGIKNVFQLNFEEDTLMTIAVIAAFVLGDFPEACMVVLLFKLGEFLEDRAINKSNENISQIAQIKANTANLIKDEETTEIVEVETLRIGDIILIKPGEKVPVDCKILEGKSNLDTSSITGESKPLEVTKDMEILSGTINLNGSLTCKVTKEFKDSTASQIIDLVYEAQNNKGNTEKFITKFSKIYTPTVIAIAVILAIVPPLFGILDFKTWIERALVFLVASCPCSLVISVPLAFFSCVGAISKKGLIIKGTKHVESLANAQIIAFDKTGTLTTGKMVVDKIQAVGDTNREDIIKWIYNLERNSTHPIATAIAEVAKKEKIDNIPVIDYEEIAGHGIKGKIEGKECLLGNQKILQKQDVLLPKEVEEDAIYLAMDGKVVGYMTVMEKVREETQGLVEKFKKIGVSKVIMLTGDNKKQAEKIANQIGVDEVYSSLLPQDKLEKIKKVKESGKQVVFVGDGINDSPVLATANFGIAMGEGTEIAGTSSDGILLSNNIGMIPNIIQTAKFSMKIIKFNITFSLIIKAIVLILGTLGIAPIWSAILADTGVTFLTVLNSMRIFKK